LAHIYHLARRRTLIRINARHAAKRQIGRRPARSMAVNMSNPMTMARFRRNAATALIGGLFLALALRRFRKVASASG